MSYAKREMVWAAKKELKTPEINAKKASEIMMLPHMTILLMSFDTTPSLIIFPRKKGRSSSVINSMMVKLYAATIINLYGLRNEKIYFTNNPPVVFFHIIIVGINLYFHQFTSCIEILYCHGGHNCMMGKLWYGWQIKYGCSSEY